MIVTPGSTVVLTMPACSELIYKDTVAADRPELRPVVLSTARCDGCELSFFGKTTRITIASWRIFACSTRCTLLLSI